MAATLIAADVEWMTKPNRVEETLTDVPPPPELCTAAFVFAFDDDGRVILSMVRKRRGLDVPGGHIDPDPASPTGRETPEEAALRELREETGAEAEGLVPIGYRTLTEPNRPAGAATGPDGAARLPYPRPVSHMAFYAARITSIGPVLAMHECGAPCLLTPEQALDVPAVARHRALFEAAVEAMRPAPAPRT